MIFAKDNTRIWTFFFVLLYYLYFYRLWRDQIRCNLQKVLHQSSNKDRILHKYIMKHLKRTSSDNSYPFNQTLIPQRLTCVNRFTPCEKLKKHNSKWEYIWSICQFSAWCILWCQVPEPPNWTLIMQSCNLVLWTALLKANYQETFWGVKHYHVGMAIRVHVLGSDCVEAWL